MPKTAPIEDRFWAKVKVREPDECWEWQASRVCGYGQIGEGPGSRRALRANRVSWELHNGKIPAGLLVCHRCDNRACVNPRHLFLGTAKENTQDMMAKGRHGGHPDYSGANNPNAKINHRIAKQIRAATGFQREIAERFGITQTQVSKIRRGEIWN